MKVLRSRLLDLQQAEQQAKNNLRSANILWVQAIEVNGSELITYPQGRVTDHRIGLTIYKLEDILHGEVDLILRPTLAHFKAESEKGQAKQLL